MRTLFHRRLFFTGFLPALLLCACQKSLRFDEGPAPDHTLIIQFKPVVDGDSLEFGKTYRNYFGESYTLRNFKFYLCQVDLINTDSGKTYRLNKDEYFLINFADNSTARISLNAVPFKYNLIAFTIGVDSIRNISGAQTGALDTANGMFWTWNSGYIMAKLEGNSTLSNQPNQVFEYHIGGFAGSESVVEKVNLNFPLNESYSFLSGGRTQMTITANANAWFSWPNPMSIVTTPVCTTPGTLAKSIAANYANMFEVVNIENE
jgi:hypothetical protein